MQAAYFMCDYEEITRTVEIFQSENPSVFESDDLLHLRCCVRVAFELHNHFVNGEYNADLVDTMRRTIASSIDSFLQMSDLARMLDDLLDGSANVTPKFWIGFAEFRGSYVETLQRMRIEDLQSSQRWFCLLDLIGMLIVYAGATFLTLSLS